MQRSPAGIGCPHGAGLAAPASIQNNCAFWRFCTHRQTHAFSSANPRKPAFPRIDPRDCKTFWSVLTPLARRPHLIRMDVAKIMLELERAWSHALPGREAVERDSVLRELHRRLGQDQDLYNIQGSERRPLLRLVLGAGG